MAAAGARRGHRPGAAHLVAIQRPLVVGADAGAPRPPVPLTGCGMDVTTVADDLVVLHDGAQVEPFRRTRARHRLRVARRRGAHVAATARRAAVPGRDGQRPPLRRDRGGPDRRAHGRSDPAGRAGRGPVPGDDEPRRGRRDRGDRRRPPSIVKGDLSTDGTDEEFAAFEACYRDRVRRAPPRRARQSRRLPRPDRAMRATVGSICRA